MLNHQSIIKTPTMRNSRFIIHFVSFWGGPKVTSPKVPKQKSQWLNHTKIREKVEWFVSHWWGTSVATYCSALRRHAYEVKVGILPSWELN